jgi:alpha-glucosidase
MPDRIMRRLIMLLMLALSAPAAAATLTARPGGIAVQAEGATFRIDALTDDVLRVRVARDGAYAEDASWAVAAAIRARHVAVKPTPDGFETKTMRVRILGPAARIVVETLGGKLISADAEQPIGLDGHAFTLRKTLPTAERIFGMGDKTGGLDRRGQSFVNWNSDAFGFSASTDPIYKSIPFFIGAGGEGGSYGLFLDNNWRSWFDFGHRDVKTIAFGAADGGIDYYLINGPSVADVVRRYADLTGKAPLAPLWAFGYQQSRWSYMSASEVRAIAARLRAERVPADVIWLDIDYQDRKRPFTTNSSTFPDLAGLAGDLKGQGIRLVAITDLHIAHAPGEGYAAYDSGVAGDHFVHNPDGSTYVAPVWPGPAVFPDFTRSATRAWWGGLYKPFVADGIAGFWNDMNEPAIFDTPTKTMPLDTSHRIATDDFAPRTATHAELHNIYGMENSRATFEGLRTLRPDERPFVMTRASFAGGQRYAVTWTGDNSSTWDHLKLSVQQLLSLGLSGFSYAGSDVGGFIGGASPELMTRWFEIAAFTPIFRDHARDVAPRAEPWVDGPEQLAIRRRFVEERYRLMPYLYALAAQNARTGDPMMRPLFYDYPAALGMDCDQSMTFTLGGQVLIAAPPKPESPEAYRVCLPAGGWYEYWSGQLAANAPISTPRLDTLPVFVRAGTILPRQPLVQSTAERPRGALMLDVYPGAECRGELYADDGHSLGYTRGDYLRQTIRCTQTAEGISIDFEAREGRYAPWWSAIAVTVHGWDGAAKVRQGRRVFAARPGAQGHSLAFVLPDQQRASRILIER